MKKKDNVFIHYPFLLTLILVDRPEEPVKSNLAGQALVLVERQPDKHRFPYHVVFRNKSPVT